MQVQEKGAGWRPVFGEDPRLEELVDAVDGQEARVGGGELGRHRHLGRGGEVRWGESMLSVR